MRGSKFPADMHNYIWCPIYIPSFMIIGSVVSEELRWQDFGTDGVTALLDLLSPLATQVKKTTYFIFLKSVLLYIKSYNCICKMLQNVLWNSLFIIRDQARLWPKWQVLCGLTFVSMCNSAFDNFIDDTRHLMTLPLYLFKVFFHYSFNLYSKCWKLIP